MIDLNSTKHIFLLKIFDWTASLYHYYILHHLSNTLIQYFIWEQYSNGTAPKIEKTHNPLCFETMKVVCSLCATISGSVIASFCTVFCFAFSA